MSDNDNLVAMTIEVVASYVAHNNLRPDDVPGFIAQTHAAIAALSAVSPPETDAAEPDAAPEYPPAVTARKSLGSREYILSMIDGKPYKTLKRHIARHGMTPADYRERFGLKADYPMTAPAYSERRREVAKTLGLGRKAGSAPAAADVAAPEPAEPEPQPSKARPARQPKASTPDEVAAQPAKRRGRPPKAAAPALAPTDG